jgi:glucan 1,3-beta-glucosidase
MAPIFAWVTILVHFFILSKAYSLALPTLVSRDPSSFFIRGVNIGGWLVLEPWITPAVFAGTNADDQWTFDSTPNATAALTDHWNTFFTEADVQSMSSYGINAIRIPIGYWAYDNSGTPYQSGADAYLAQAIEWARNAGIKVWIDLHGAPGSQNGQGHSGHAGSVTWQQGNNLHLTTSVLQTIASKYGTGANSDVVIGIELINEPSTSGSNSFATTQAWAISAYKAVRTSAQNQNLQIIMHDTFMPAADWLLATITQMTGQSGLAAIDTHAYQLYTTADNSLNEQQHVAEACAWSNTLFGPWKALGIPIYAGEFSAITNICVNPDGSTFPGTVTASACNGVEYCQCLGDTDSSKWGNMTVAWVSRYVNAQLQTFESSSNGYFFWNWKGLGGWDFRSGVEQGWIPSPLTNYEKVC